MRMCPQSESGRAEKAANAGRAGFVQRFHSDEAGMEAIQAVMIIAFSAVVVLAVWKVWADVPVTVNGKQVLGVRGWFQEVIASFLTIDT